MASLSASRSESLRSFCNAVPKYMSSCVAAVSIKAAMRVEQEDSIDRMSNEISAENYLASGSIGPALGASLIPFSSIASNVGIR